MVLKLHAGLAFWAVYSLGLPGIAQTVSPSMLRMTVMVNGTSGSGVVIGDDSNDIYIATAAHVVGGAGNPASVEFVPNLRLPQLACAVLISSRGGNASVYAAPDIAVVRCAKAGAKYRFSYDLVGEITELRPSARLVLVGNAGKKLGVPLSYFIFSQALPLRNPQMIEYFNPLSLNMEGASGGPLLTDRSELLGLQVRQTDTLMEALPWSWVRQWIVGENVRVPIKLSKRARSAPALRAGSVESSVSLSSLFVPNFGWLTPAPKLRIAAALPNLSNIDVAFDFTFTDATKQVNGFEKLSLVVPAVTAEYQFGSALGPLRRRELLGGLYVAAGIAPLFLKDTLQITQEQTNIQAWTGIFDVGWRYRFPGRSWGLTGSYREGILLGETAQGLYPRFRSISGGVFVVFR
jgi:hypothetical protein